MKIMIGVNTLTAVEQPVYANHMQFFFRLGRNTEHEFAMNTPRRMSIDRMRNMTAKIALEQEYDYVLFIDDDVVIPINSLQKLIDADKDIIAGWTLIRGYPFQNMFFKYQEGKLSHLQEFEPDSNGLVEVDAVGFSYALIKCSLLRKVNPTWFVTGPYNTEDIYFCIKAKTVVPETSIFVDTTIKTWHILGPEMIGIENRETYSEYYKKTFPELIDPIHLIDRDEEYLKMVKSES